jgi:hypothetical protein
LVMKYSDERVTGVYLMGWMAAWSVARMAGTGQIRLGNRHSAREIFGSRFLLSLPFSPHPTAT